MENRAMGVEWQVEDAAGRLVTGQSVGRARSAAGVLVVSSLLPAQSLLQRPQL
jgi:hypothetical protein